MPLLQHRFIGSTAAGETWNFSWWVQATRTEADAHTAAIAWITALWNGPTAGTGYAEFLNTATSADSITTLTIDPATGKQLTRRDSALALPGTATANPMPADVALVISLRTALPQRSGRGRFYLPQPCVDTVTAEGRCDTTFLATLRTALENAWTGYDTSGDRPVIYSRSGKTSRNIVSFDIGDLFDTQRRRENKLSEARISATMP